MFDPALILERSQRDHFWIPDGTVTYERQGLSYLSSPQDVPHLNAVTHTEPAECDLDAAVSEVSTVHRTVHSRWQVYSRIDSEPLQRALAKGEYRPNTELDARLVSVGAHRPRPAADCRIARASDMQTLLDFNGVTNAAFDLTHTYSREQLEAQLRQCSEPDSRVQRFVAYRGERAVAAGGLNVFGALGLGLLWAGSTVPEARGQGAYSALVTARIDWARQRGLASVGLYAVTTTSSPIAAKQGFVKYGSMTYWERRPEVGLFDIQPFG